MHEADPMGKTGVHLSCCLQAKAGLADTARTEKSQEANLWTGKLGTHGCHVLLTSDERGGQDRHIEEGRLPGFSWLLQGRHHDGPSGFLGLTRLFQGQSEVPYLHKAVLRILRKCLEH